MVKVDNNEQDRTVISDLRPGSLSVFGYKPVQWISAPTEQFVDFLVSH